MRFAIPVLLLVLAASCGSPRAAPPVAPAGLILLPEVSAAPAAVEADELPDLPATVSFRITWIRDWDTYYYATGSSDLELTLGQARALGIPASLWLFGATHTPAGYWFTIYLVRPSRT